MKSIQFFYIISIAQSLIIEAIRSFETSGTVYRKTQRNIAPNILIVR